LTALAAARAVHRRAGEVSDPLFASSEFFDARDAVQVKYEMVRRARAGESSVSAAAAAFGFSRQSFYQAAAALEAGGLPGLLPGRPGPRGPRKLTGEVVDHLVGLREADPALSSAESVTELVGVQRGQAGLAGAAADDLVDAGGGHGAAAAAEPERGQVGVGVAHAEAEVAVEGLGGLGPEREVAGAAALADDVGEVGVASEGDVGLGEFGDFGQAGAGVEEHADDGGVAAGGEVLAGADGDELSEVAVGDDGDGGLRDDRGGHLRHRVGGGFFFLDEPFRPLLERAVGQRDRGGAHLPGDHGGEQALDVGAGEVVGGGRPVGGRQVAEQVVDGVPVDPDRFR
jgi:hypothetical protein